LLLLSLLTGLLKLVTAPKCVAAIFANKVSLTALVVFSVNFVMQTISHKQIITNEKMKLENQVVSLDLAKRLKELGVKQESYFYWLQNWEENDWSGIGKWVVAPSSRDDRISAFTVAELGEKLQPYLNRDIWVQSDIGEVLKESVLMKDEANNRAKMLIYLLENKLTTSET
jgi:hypothetical protein